MSACSSFTFTLIPLFFLEFLLFTEYKTRFHSERPFTLIRRKVSENSVKYITQRQGGEWTKDKMRKQCLSSYSWISSQICKLRKAEKELDEEEEIAQACVEGVIGGTAAPSLIPLTS